MRREEIFKLWRNRKRLNVKRAHQHENKTCPNSCFLCANLRCGSEDILIRFNINIWRNWNGKHDLCFDMHVFDGLLLHSGIYLFFSVALGAIKSIDNAFYNIFETMVWWIRGEERACIVAHWKTITHASFNFTVHVGGKVSALKSIFRFNYISCNNEPENLLTSPIHTFPTRIAWSSSSPTTRWVISQHLKDRVNSSNKHNFVRIFAYPKLQNSSGGLSWVLVFRLIKMSGECCVFVWLLSVYSMCTPKS